MNQALRQLLDSQCGVARRDQLLAHGLSVGQIRSHLRAGRWRALGIVVVVTHNGPLSRRQQCWAGVLSAGEGAMLAGLTALEASGLRRWESKDVHVLQPRAATRASVSEVPVVRHETRRPPARSRLMSGFPRCAPVERAAVDAASWRRDTRSGTALLAAVVQQRLTTAARLDTALKTAGSVRHGRALRLAISDIRGGAQALSELDFAQLCRDHELGDVVGQVVRLDDRGRRRYLDGEIVSRDGKRLAFEIDGSVHLLPSSYWSDMHRQNELLIVGTPLLRFSSYAVRFERPVVADQVRRAFAAL
jgi:hypothetical protein